MLASAMGFNHQADGLLELKSYYKAYTYSRSKISQELSEF